MTEPCRCHLGFAPARGSRFGGSGGGRPPILTNAFAPKLSYPLAHACAAVARLDTRRLHRAHPFRGQFDSCTGINAFFAASRHTNQRGRGTVEAIALARPMK